MDNYPWFLCFWFLVTITLVSIFCQNTVKANNVTSQVFGTIQEGIVAAFGDFNSDELTDVFLIRDRRQTLQILLGELTAFTFYNTIHNIIHYLIIYK